MFTSAQDTPRSISFTNVLFPLSIFAIALLAFSVSASAVHQYFVADDFIFLNQLHFRQPTIVDNLMYFGRDWGMGVPFYRPMTRIFWAIQYGFFGLDALGWHLVSVALYTLTACMVFLLSFEVSRHLLVAFATALWFLVSPVHPEIISWTANQADLFVGVLSLAGVLFYIRAKRTFYDRSSSLPRFMILYSLVLLCFSLGLLCKESAAGFVLMPFSYDLLFGPFSKALQNWRNWRGWLRLLVWQLPILGVLAIYLAIRLQVLGNIGGYGSLSNMSSTGTQVFIESYTKWLFVPFSPTHPLLGAFWLVVISGLLVYTLVKYIRPGKVISLRGAQKSHQPAFWENKHTSLAFFGLLWTIAFLLPTVSTPPSLRLAYLSTVGVALFVGPMLTLVCGRALLRLQQARRERNISMASFLPGLLLVPVFLITGAAAILSFSDRLYKQDAWYRAGQLAQSTLHQIHEGKPDLVSYSYVYAIGLPDANEEAPIFRTGFPYAVQLMYDDNTIEAVSGSSFPIIEGRLNQAYFVEYRNEAIINREDVVNALLERNSSLKAKVKEQFISWDFASSAITTTDNTRLGWQIIKGYSSVQNAPGGLNIMLRGDSTLAAPLFDLPAPSLGSLELTLRATPRSSETGSVPSVVHWLVGSPTGLVERGTSPIVIQADGLSHTYSVKPVEISDFLYSDDLKEIWIDFPADLSVVNISQVTLFRLP